MFDLSLKKLYDFDDIIQLIDILGGEVMKLELIDKVVKDSLEHGNTIEGTPSFTKEQMELLSQTIKAAFEEYHRQMEEK